MHPRLQAAYVWFMSMMAASAKEEWLMRGEEGDDSFLDIWTHFNYGNPIV